jgi:hypothetical protein
MGCLVAGPPCSPKTIRHPPPPLTHVPPPSFCTIEKQDSQKAKQNAIIKKIGQERDLEAQNPISHPPPHLILYVYTVLFMCIHYCGPPLLYTYSLHKISETLSIL